MLQELRPDPTRGNFNLNYTCANFMNGKLPDADQIANSAFLQVHHAPLPA